jgi:hypothetical protein
MVGEVVLGFVFGLGMIILVTSTNFVAIKIISLVCLQI